MHVIGRKALREFAFAHADSEAALNAWFKVAERAEWKSLVEVRAVYPHADPVGECMVFNIHGNRYRLICGIDYEEQMIYIKHVLTHQDYDRGRWKSGC